MDGKRRNEMRIPRITVGAVRGGSGKTVVALGMIRALRQDHVNVLAFKKGPDYIDAGWLALASGRDCYNLDPFLMKSETIISSFGYRAAMAELAVIEGNRGLYDGVDVEGSFSTAELARLLSSPVLLVVDCTKATRSIAAVVKGFAQFDTSVRLAGVVFNRVGGSRHETLLRKTVEHYTDIPVLGAVTRFRRDPLPMRHLGLTPREEHAESISALDDLASVMRNSIDLERIIEIAKEASVWNVPVSNPLDTIRQIVKDGAAHKPVIGVIRDAAFQFYYPENLEAIERAGGALRFIDAENNPVIPDDIDALYIGGGFPETRAERLSANKGFLDSLRHKVCCGMPVYAECGGLMYLGNTIKWQGRTYAMSGVLKWDFITGRMPVGHGYSVIEAVDRTPFFDSGIEIKGHEFHYSKPEPAPDRMKTDDYCACIVKRGHGFMNGMEGVCSNNVFGTYTHVHVLDNAWWAEGIVFAAMRHAAEKRPDGFLLNQQFLKFE